MPDKVSPATLRKLLEEAEADRAALQPLLDETEGWDAPPEAEAQAFIRGEDDAEVEMGTHDVSDELRVPKGQDGGGRFAAGNAGGGRPNLEKGNDSAQSASTPIDKPAASSDNKPVETKPQPQETKMDATATKQPYEMTGNEYSRAYADADKATRKPDGSRDYEALRVAGFTGSYQNDVLAALRAGKPVPQQVIDSMAKTVEYQQIAKLKAEFGENYADKLKEKAAKFANIHDVVRRHEDGSLTVRQRQTGPQTFHAHAKGEYVSDGESLKVVAKANRPYKGRHDGEVTGYFQDITLRDLKPKEEVEAKATKAASYALSHGGEPRNQDYPDLKKKQMAEYSEFVRQALGAS